MKLSEKFGVDRCVIVPTIALVASVFGHDTAHPGCGDEIDAMQSIHKTGGPSVNDRSAPNES
jgi:hypothetical protein